MSVLSVAARTSQRLPGGRAKIRAGRGFAQVAIRCGAAPVCRTILDDGSVLDLDARSRTEASAIWQGSYESEYRQALTALLDRSEHRVYYDVGANVGLLAVPTARHLREHGTVVCFEPVERNAASLGNNLSLNGITNCALYQVALGNEPGEAQIALDSAFGAATGNAVLTGGSTLPTAYRSVQTVRVVRLDDLIREHGFAAPDVVKLDVEGSEVGFLRGAARTLAASRPVILGEFNSQLMPNFGTSFVDAAAALPAEYAIFSFAAGNRIEERHPSVGLGDVLLVPREKVASLRDLWEIMLLA